MKGQEKSALEKFLKEEFSALSQPQEAKWVFEELENLENSLALGKAQEIIQRRKNGEPLAYILGHWDFRKLRLEVGSGVLIPRPETEEMVDLVLEHLRSNDHSVVADLGSGSGAIAYALASESSKPLEIYAVEKSAEAFVFLEKNYRKLEPEKQKNVRLLHADWEDAQLPLLDVIVSNPPYVSFEEYAALDKGVSAYEPKSALIPQDERDPMSAYKSLINLAQKKLKRGGAVFFEFGPAQEGLWGPLMGDFQFKVCKDLSGKPRVLYAFDFAPKGR